MAEDIVLNSTSEAVMRLPGESMAYRKNGEKRRVAVIGAGPAGLGALRRLSELPDTEIFCFEQASALGGTWLYTDVIGPDQYGVPVHSSLYKNLKTNLPKEVMHFPDFPYSEGIDHSYVDASDVLSYLHEFKKEYDLDKYIKYNHRVIRVTPLLDLWSLSAMDLQTKHESTYVFDAVLVCSGPNITPVYPKIELAKFSGHQIHSKNYKIPDPYKGKRVLIIGLGPSGLDITYQVSTMAEKVIVSTNRKSQNQNGLPVIEFPDNSIIKPSVLSVEDKEVKFEDETIETVDAIIHCTGYTFNFPFLTPECGVTVDQYVFPLYKHFICIERPNLAIIGLPKFCPHLFMVDYQVKCFIKALTGEIQLPNKDEMMASYQAELDEHISEKKPKKTFHRLGKELTDRYFHDLAELGHLEHIPPVLLSMFNEAFRLVIRDFKNFRENRFKVIDNETYQVTKDLAVES